MLCTSHSVYTFLSIAISIPWANGYIEVLNSYNVRVAGFTSHEVVESATLVETVSGIIVSADPPDACERIRDAQQFNTSSAFSKFVLITYLSSSNCSVSEKIQNAANAHFDLAVMYGESFFMPGTDFIKKMLGDTGDIPAVVVAYSDGETIRDKYLYNNKTLEYYLTVIPKNDMRYYFFLFGVVIGVCFLVIIFFMVCLLVKYIQERRRSRRNRLSSRQIKQLPTEKYTKGSQFDVCAICLEDYVEGDKLRILPCSHVYHAKCIDPWLMENRRNCPLCKRRVRLGDSSSESDSDSDGASPTESTPLVTPTSGDNTWGTFTGPSTSGEQLGQSGSRRSEGSTMSHALIVNEDTDSSESENVAALPPGAGSVNAMYEDDVLDFRPKSV